MRSPMNRETKAHELRVPLAPETEEALSQIAQENGLTLDEEAESIIKNHLENAAGSTD